ncbi:MAG: two-component regulator propeller domain-containing protein [Flavobacteriales bacterium]
MHPRTILRQFVLLLSAAVAPLLHAQQYGFLQWTPADGLAQSQVRCIAQDGKGFLWFGTLGGASRFDGLVFMNLALQEGVPDAQISAMATAQDGTLWMGAGSHLVSRNGTVIHVEALPPAARGSRIQGLAATGDRLVVGTDGGGCFVRDSTGIRPLPGYPMDTAAYVRCLLALRDGSLLIGTRTGLIHQSNGTARSVALGNGTPRTVTALAEAQDGSWWVGTSSHGLYHLSEVSGQRHFDEESGLLLDHVRCVLVDDRDRVWVGSKFGLNLLEEGRMRVFTVHQGMPNDNITAAFQDRNGDLWFGTDGAGFLRYAGERFVTFTLKDGLCSDLVMNMTTDADGDIWLGTYDNGVCRMDGMAQITTFDGLPNNTVWCGSKDDMGRLWFGTSGGLACVVNGVVQELPFLDSLADQRILSLHLTSDGTLWCGMRDGLARIGRDGSLDVLDASSGAIGRSIRCITSDASGALWLASENGLYRLQNGRTDRWTTKEGLCDNTVQALCLDGQGRLWIGTTNGLSCWNGKSFTTVRPADDFGSNFIDLLRSDGDGRLWVGTNNGLYHFDPDELFDGSMKMRHFGNAQGLRSLEFNLNASHLDEQGRLFFGSTGGLVMYRERAGDGHRSVDPPVVHLTALRSFLQRTDWRDQSKGTDQNGLPVGLKLAYRRNYLTFDYVGISLADPAEVRYRYRLVGYDQDWLPATDARFASYSNLSHGTYTFEVAATIDGANWSEPARFSFDIERPYWLQWWFFLVCAVLAITAAWGIHLYRQAIRQRHERTRQLMLRSRMLQLEQQALNANMNRHFVFNALNSIQYHINKQDRITASRYLTSFAKLIRKNLDASQNDTTSLAEELERLELYLTLEHMRFKDKFRYRIEVAPEVDTRHVQLPAMMLQPYVENSIWHGILPMDVQGEVVIRVEPSGPGRVRVIIEDDGVGLEQSLRRKEGSPSDHISRGIEITKGRADVLRKLDLSDIRIQGPEPRSMDADPSLRGTRVSVELPA